MKLANLQGHSDNNRSPPRRRRSPSPDRSYLSLGRDRDYGYSSSHYGEESRGYDSTRSIEAKVRKELAEVAYLKELTLSRDRDDHYGRVRETERRCVCVHAHVCVCTCMCECICVCVKAVCVKVIIALYLAPLIRSRSRDRMFARSRSRSRSRERKWSDSRGRGRMERSREQGDEHITSVFVRNVSVDS